MIKKTQIAKKKHKRQPESLLKIVYIPHFLVFNINLFILYLNTIFFSFLINPILNILVFNFFDKEIIFDLFLELNVVT